MTYDDIMATQIAADTRSAVRLYNGDGIDIRSAGAHPISGDELARIKAGL